MSKRRGAGRGADGDDDLIQALNKLGADHEPDTTAIRQRIAGSSVRLPVGDSASPPRSGRFVLLPAAAVLLVAGGIAYVASPADQPATPANGVPPVSIPLAPSSSGTRTSPPGRTPEGTSTSLPASPSRTVPPSSDRPASSGPAVPARSPDSGVSVRTVSQRSPFSVELASPSLLDWVAVGARADLKQVRAKISSADPMLTVDQPTGALVTGPGSFRVSWTGGVPEQDHDGADTWLKSPGTEGFRVTVGAAHKARTVVLYAATTDLRAAVSIGGAGIKASGPVPRSTTSQPRPVIITVTLPPTDGPAVIQVRGSRDGQQPAVYLAAATVR